MLKKLLRIFIGSIFIVSGFVKAVDAVGFSFKLEEYFSPSVFNLPFLEPFVLPMAVVVSVLEVILGIMLFFKIQFRWALWSLIILCIFFGFLTFYSAYYNVVTDCGCFGDALKLEPWQSFWKDIILLFGLFLLWFAYRNYLEEKTNIFKYGFLFFLTLLVFFVVFWGIRNEPIIDFRDYKVGTNLRVERLKFSKNPSQYKTFYHLRNKKTGEEKKINQDDYITVEEYWNEGSSWEIIPDKTTSEIVKQGYHTEIIKLRLENAWGEDITEDVLNEPKVALVFSYNPKKMSNEKRLEAERIAKGYPKSYGVSTEKSTFASLENLNMDGTAIKTIARSNPFLLVIENGKIVEKKPL